MNLKPIITLALILFVFSCSNNPHQESLELNNGEKWVVVESMILYIRAMEQDVYTFQNTPDKDYSMLADKLQENIELLVSNCTMKGKSHDELHKWLHPYMGMINELKNVENENEANQIIKRMEKSFITFNQYFE